MIPDLFAGPGGWSEGLRRLNLRDVGLEWDTSACKTRAAAGHATIQCDVTQYPTEPFKGRIRGLIASPPCQSWSRAGKRGGVRDQQIVHEVVRDLACGIDRRAEVMASAAAARRSYEAWDAAWRAAADEHGWWTDKVVRREDAWFSGLATEPTETPERVTVKVLSAHGKRERAHLFGAPPPLVLEDERSLLAAEPMRWLYDLRPEWACLEEVPDVLPLFRQIAEILRGWGYSVWVGVLNAANYGVPQTRKRAILIASRVRKVTAPAPTHTQHPLGESLFGESLPGWVSMAEALGWGATDRVSPTVTAGGGKSGGAEPFPSQARQALLDAQARGAWALRSNSQANATVRNADEPASTLFFGTRGGAETEWVLRNGTQKNAAVRRADEPAGTLFFGARCNDVSWVRERPAPTIVTTRRSKDGIVLGRQLPAGQSEAVGGHGWDGDTTSSKGGDAVRITVEEASVLQSFPTDYPWQGTKTKKFECVGNAVPPLLAAHVIAAATGIPVQEPQAVPSC